MDDCAFMIAAPKLWNSLPLNIRQATTIDTFERSLKTYLFAKTLINYAQYKKTLLLLLSSLLLSLLLLLLLLLLLVVLVLLLLS